jgi:hypothetical protein
MPARSAVRSAVRTVVRAALGLLLITAGVVSVAALEVVATTVAGAAGSSTPAAGSSTPAGSSVSTSPQNPETFPLVLTSIGHVRRESGWVFTVHLLAGGLGSRVDPGTITVDGERWGTWYAAPH